MKKKLYPAVAAPFLLTFTLLTCVTPAVAGPKSYATAYQGAAASASVSVNEADARKIALDHAKVKEEELSLLKQKLDYDHDNAEYELEFYVGNTEYEYEIDAATGAILKSSSGVDFEVRNDGSPASTSSPSGLISEARAKAIALGHAKVDEKGVALFKIKLDYDHGRASEYEIEFYAGGLKYEYEIAPNSGEVLKYGSAADPDIRIPAPANPAGGVSPGPVSEEAAKKAALGRVRGATDANIRIWTEYEDGKKVYEGKIIYGETEYEFEIDAATGAVLEWKSESVYD